ncbi:hypothetical protein ACFL56_01985 [Candidatus Margulisiibacteriota bacterium]
MNTLVNQFKEAPPWQKIALGILCLIIVWRLVSAQQLNISLNNFRITTQNKINMKSLLLKQNTQRNEDIQRAIMQKEKELNENIPNVSYNADMIVASSMYPFEKKMNYNAIKKK